MACENGVLYIHAVNVTEGGECPLIKSFPITESSSRAAEEEDGGNGQDGAEAKQQGDEGERRKKERKKSSLQIAIGLWGTVLEELSGISEWSLELIIIEEIPYKRWAVFMHMWHSLA